MTASLALLGKQAVAARAYFSGASSMRDMTIDEQLALLRIIERCCPQQDGFLETIHKEFISATHCSPNLLIEYTLGLLEKMEREEFIELKRDGNEIVGASLGPRDCAATYAEKLTCLVERVWDEQHRSTGVGELVNHLACDFDLPGEFLTKLESDGVVKLNRGALTVEPGGRTHSSNRTDRTK
jgi:hypothetical protein